MSSFRSGSFPLLILAFGAIGGAGLYAGGCTVLTNDAPPDDAGVFEGGDANAAAQTCSACVVDQCTSAMALCLSDDACNAIRACASSCSDIDAATTCRTTCACAAKTTDGGISAESRFRAFTSCADARTCAPSSCATDCASTCAAAPPSTTPSACSDSPPDAGQPDADTSDASIDDASLGDAGGDAGVPIKVSVDGCASCGDDKCGAAKKACAIGSECAAFLSCVAACSEATCSTECGTKYATGKNAAQELASCVEAGCREACGLN